MGYKMLLVLDIGNTNITLGLYDDENLIKTFRLETNKNSTTEEYSKKISNLLSEYPIKSCIIGSVVDDLNIILKNACDKVFNINSLVFNNTLETGIALDVAEPHKVGVDRIANAYASYKLYPQPSIVIDSGSATTFDIISADGRFFGGIIMPGINMQLNSLCEKTSKLPKIEIEEIDNTIGTDTKSCILSGVIRGHVCAIEGLIEQCEKELGQKATVIITGGISPVILKYLKRKIDYMNETLTIEGFKLLYKLNNKCNKM